MRSKNNKKLVEFKGEHSIFEDGKFYTISDYVKVCNELNGDIIKYRTMKSRLYRTQYCTPKQLKPACSFTKNSLLSDTEAQKCVATRSNLETNSERIMAKWLRVKL
jgi:hypothetical protein|tara:strand:- start:344 stop:661 length:318 start_codon:yes stop_codon:yes gene_type:complete